MGIKRTWKYKIYLKYTNNLYRTNTINYCITLLTYIKFRYIKQTIQVNNKLLLKLISSYVLLNTFRFQFILYNF